MEVMGMAIDEGTLDQTELENMEPKAAFDAIMVHAPFLRTIIENKIAAEVEDRDTEISKLKGNMDEMSSLLLMTMMAGGAE